MKEINVTDAEVSEVREWLQGARISKPLRGLVLSDDAIRYWVASCKTGESDGKRLARRLGIRWEDERRFRKVINKAMRRITGIGEIRYSSLGNKEVRIACICGEETTFTEMEVYKKRHPQCRYCGRLVETPTRLEMLDVLAEMWVARGGDVIDDPADEDDEYIRKKFQ